MVEVPRINKWECCGCGLCTYALPEVFRLTPGSTSEVIASDKASRAEIQKVIDNCPCMAIKWYKQ